MRVVREAAKLPDAERKRRIRLPRSTFLNGTIKQRAYPHSRESFVRKVMVPVMQGRFWPDSRCRAIVQTLRELKPGRLLDIASGPGGLLCAAMPDLQSTQAVGLEIHFDKCRTVLAEAKYFGFADRLDM